MVPITGTGRGDDIIMAIGDALGRDEDLALIPSVFFALATSLIYLIVVRTLVGTPKVANPPKHKIN